METPKVDSAALGARLRDAVPATGETTPPVPPKPDQQQLVDELGAGGDPLDQRIADAEDYKPEEEGGGSDAERQTLASQIPPVNRMERMEKRLEDAEDAEDAKIG